MIFNVRGGGLPFTVMSPITAGFSRGGGGVECRRSRSVVVIQTGRLDLPTEGELAQATELVKSAKSTNANMSLCGGCSSSTS